MIRRIALAAAVAVAFTAAPASAQTKDIVDTAVGAGMFNTLVTAVKAAGLTHGGFYAHFDSKDALVAAAIDQMFEQARARFLAEVKDLPPAAALNAYVDFYLSEGHRDARTGGCPIPVLAGDLPPLEGFELSGPEADRVRRRLVSAGHLPEGAVPDGEADPDGG